MHTYLTSQNISTQNAKDVLATTILSQNYSKEFEIR